MIIYRNWSPVSGSQNTNDLRIYATALSGGVLPSLGVGKYDEYTVYAIIV